MNDYLLLLGREPELSVAEIVALGVRKQRTINWVQITDSYALVKTDLEPIFFRELAGIVKLAQPLGLVKREPQLLKTAVYKVLSQLTTSEAYFGFSWYGGRSPRWLTPLGLSIKKDLRRDKSRVRLVVSREPVLSSVVVAKNKLLGPSGCEFVLISSGSDVLVGKTLQVQDFEAWSERDYHKPVRDPKVGMLPPKLARLMLNLAVLPQEAAVLDPFCGSGTVVLEAALLGYKKLFGTDISEVGIKGARQNIDWLGQQHPELNFNIEFKSVPVESLNQVYKNGTLDAIVTEPYLGPPLKGAEDDARLRQIYSELEKLYKSALIVFSYLIKTQGSLVMVWPVLKGKTRTYQLNLQDFAKSLGFRPINYLPKEAPPEWTSPRGSLLYEREGQRIAREIFLWRKV